MSNPPPVLSLYVYRATVLHIVDGDTVDLSIDLGMGIWIRSERIRLLGINAPELKGATKEAAMASRNKLIELIDGKSVIIQTVKDEHEKYGRLLARIWVNDAKGESVFVNDYMVENNFAVPYNP